MAGNEATNIIGYNQMTTTTTWPSWNISYVTTTATTNIVSSQIIWTNWTTVGTTTGATINNLNIGWNSWNDRWEVKAQATEAEVKATLERQKKAEAEHAERMRVYNEQETKRVAQVMVARRRAEDLLRRHLTDEQREDLEKKNCFYLESIGKKGERRKYRIDRGTHGNVKLLDKDGRIVGQYCVQPDGVPAEDAMLAQKLWIEADEEKFIKVANFSRFG